MPSCGRDNGFSGTSWLNQFTTVNNSLLKEVENVTVSAGESCSLFELQKYKVSFQKFIEVAREFFLPPEKYRYAVVHEKSLLPLLNVEGPILGLVTVQFSGCPSCSQVLKEVDDLKAVLQSQPSPVSEVSCISIPLGSLNVNGFNISLDIRITDLLECNAQPS